MIYLALQILFWLILAVLFGIFIGWLIWRRTKESDGSETQNLRQMLKTRDEEITSLKDNVGQCESMLKLYKEEMEEACRPDFVPQLPAAIPQATANDADDLQKISGVGPFLEGKLNAYGIYTFKQVAALEPNVIAELGETFGSFSDRIVREDWVSQAKQLHEAKFDNSQ
jgi:predicted flap endonuclease-1-like 5' DNA nuclease